MPSKTTLDRVFLALLVVAALLLVFQLTAGLLFAPPGHDGSYYLAHARYVSRGLVPYRDFPTPYSAGFYYANGWLNEQQFIDPVWGKVTMYVASLLNAV